MRLLQEKTGWIVAFATLLLAIPLIYAWKSPSKVQLPVYGTVPSTSLTNERGEPFPLENLRGQVWVTDFIFTSCRDICPGLTLQMKALQERLKKEAVERVALVSITVDPATDTPEKLAAYAAANGADPKLWTFLTGDLSTLEATVVKGFRVSMERDRAPDQKAGDLSLMSITHGNRFILVDRQMGIRGYYDVTADGSDQLLTDLKRL